MSGMNKAERLEEMKRLYIQRAFSDIEMAERLGVDRTLIYRDRIELSAQYPIEKDDEGRYHIPRSKLISEIKVNLHEALTLYLAARKTSRQTRFHQPHTANAVEKLAATLRQPMTERLLKSADRLLQQEKNPDKIKIIETIAQAWVEQRKVRIEYQALTSDGITRHTISPYIIEPSIWSDSVYVIAQSDFNDKIFPFKIERIISATLSGETFEIPGTFDDEQLLKHAWGIWYGDKEPDQVTLRFSPAVTRRVKESIWHPLEKVEDMEDGGCIWSAEVAEWREMLPWVRGWGADCEVIEPKALREALVRETRDLAELYKVVEMKKKLFAHFREKDKDHKEPQYLWDHLTKVSKDTGKFASKIGLQKSGEAIGLLHDLGKASNIFQKYLLDGEGLSAPDADNVNYKAMKGKIDHSTAGAQVIFEKLKANENNSYIVAQGLALCIASHHSGLIDCLLPDGKNDFQRRIKKAEEDAHKKEAEAKLPDVLQLLNDDFLKEIQTEFLQKINSLTESGDSDQTKAFKEGLLLRFLLSCLLDADRLDTADFENPTNTRIRNYGEYHSWEVLIKRFNLKLDEFSEKKEKNKVDELRDQISEACYEFSTKPKGVYQLTVPTGGGKTLASLRFALNHAAHHSKLGDKIERIFYIIPYTSIIDQNADDIRKVLEDKDENGKLLDKVVLEHHSNLTPDEETRRQNLLAQNWDAPLVFTTQVQFLEALFGSGTQSARRMHQLANSVIIFDEVQTLPIKCLHMFNVATRFLVRNCGTSVVLCTATQPPLEQVGSSHRALSAQPIIQNEPELFKELKRVQVLDERGTSPKTDVEIADLAEQELQTKGSVLIVVNTKKSARDLYKVIAERKIAKTYHLSTNMCPAHRAKVLDEIKDVLPKEPIICVSTQLIEAGVDVDFGSVIRYLAGLDSITQAAGRCNRNGNQRDSNGNPALGRVLIVERENEKTDGLEDITIGIEQTKRILRQFKENPEKFEHDIIGLKAVAEYYKWYFSRQGEDKMKYEVGKKSFIERTDNLFNVLSENKQAIQAHDGDVDIFFKQSFQSAAKSFEVIDKKTQGVIVSYGKGEEIIGELKKEQDIEKRYKLLRQAQKYSINLYFEKFNQLRESGMIQEVQKDLEIYYMEKIYYDEKQLGWIEDPFMEV